MLCRLSLSFQFPASVLSHRSVTFHEFDRIPLNASSIILHLHQCCRCSSSGKQKHAPPTHSHTQATHTDKISIPHCYECICHPFFLGGSLSHSRSYTMLPSHLTDPCFLNELWHFLPFVSTVVTKCAVRFFNPQRRHDLSGEICCPRKMSNYGYEESRELRIKETHSRGGVDAL